MILSVKSGSKTEFIDITSKIQDAVRASGIREGFCIVYVPHTTAGVN